MLFRGIHAGDQNHYPRYREPEHELDQPDGGERAARRDRQNLRSGADRGRGQDAEGEEMDHGEHRPKPAGEARCIARGEEQDEPQQHVKHRGGSEETER